MENKYNCPLIKLEIDETVCYDLQMVLGNMINKRILQDYDFSIKENLATKERSEIFCENCPFNQLKNSIIKNNKNKIYKNARTSIERKQI